MICDTHCHLNLEDHFSDLDLIINKARDKGITRILVPGINYSTSQKAVQLCDKYPEIFAAVGIHPNEANAWNKTSYHQLRALAIHPKVVAIGEIGLDLYRKYTPLPIQTYALEQQLMLATETNKPVILHNRDATKELFHIIEAWIEKNKATNQRPDPYIGVFHSYFGDLKTAQRIIDLGFLIGISGPITFKNDHGMREIVSTLFGKSMIAETDSPYQSPVPHRGEPNEPSNIIFIYEMLSTILKENLETTVKRISQYSNQLFRWDQVT